MTRPRPSLGIVALVMTASLIAGAGPSDGACCSDFGYSVQPGDFVVLAPSCPFLGGSACNPGTMTHMWFLDCIDELGRASSKLYPTTGTGEACIYCRDLVGPAWCPPVFEPRIYFQPNSDLTGVDGGLKIKVYNAYGVRPNVCGYEAPLEHPVRCTDADCPCFEDPGKDLIPPPECPESPLVLDLGRRGFRFTSLEEGVRFDLDADGIAEHTSWTAMGGEDGFLVFDRNGDGAITSGAEMFGNNTPQPDTPEPNGFAALAVFDDPELEGNGDGVIDAADRIFQALQVWRDVNKNGVSEATELLSLGDVGVRSIDLGYWSAGRKDRFGNEMRYLSWYAPTNSNGDHWFITDVWFWTATS